MLIIPTLFYIKSKKSSSFKRYVGYFILIFLGMLFLRGTQAFFTIESNLFSQSFIQSGTFITLLLLLFISGAGLLLIMYEKADALTKELANLDYLTRIPNRRYFMNKANLYLKRLQFSKKQMAILFIDIDFFKHINDKYGHLCVDEVLIQLARIINESIRPTDICCRYGGEEFVVLLNEADNEQALTVGKRIHERAKEIKVNYSNHLNCTISVGVYSAIPSASDTLEKFIDKSDQALYQIKISGRNNVSLLKEN